MDKQDIRDRIKSRLYGEDYARGVLEFSWGDEDPDIANERLVAAKQDLLDISIRWVDSEPFGNRITVLSPKDHAESVVKIMTKYGFVLVNQIFDPKPSDKLHGTEIR